MLTCLLLAIALCPGCDNVKDVVDMPDPGKLDVIEDPDAAGRVDAPPGLDTVPEDERAVPEEVWLEIAPDDVEPGCDPGEGCFLDECTGNSDCQSGWCVEYLGQKVCSTLCQEECPEGWVCSQVAGTFPDVVYICVSKYANLCRPCESGDDCKSVGGAEDVCVDYGEEGSFCGGKCVLDEDCPWGFSCKDSQSVDGIELKQCTADAKVCACTTSSIELGLWTPCETENEWGICSGKRVCAEEGLTDCDASIPAEETCNGLDDDCDDAVDEPLEQAGDYINLCNDDNDCTQDKCNGVDGCDLVPLDDVECMDGNPCTVADHCEQGACVGTAVDCDDMNPCTDDICDEAGGCKYENNSVDCDDEDPCTLGDQCKEGECAGVSANCDCQVDADCDFLDDGNLCNGTLFCDKAKLPYQCKVEPGTPVECPEPEGLGAICKTPACDPETGACSFAPDHEEFLCEDGDKCTVGDKCMQGVCEAGVAANCNDGNKCTDDSCMPDEGCLHDENTAPCNDGDLCTMQDQCEAGICAPGDPLQCDDGNVCTDDSCDPDAGCTFETNENACDDGDACTTGDHCTGGSCTWDWLKDCDDQNLCTNDLCDSDTGCTYVIIEGECSDGDPCTVGDHCQLGACVPGTLQDCNDGNPCTADSCGPSGLCAHEPSGGLCDDLNACTLGDHCEEGACTFDEMANCEDQNPCTNDACNQLVGCTHEHNNNACEDGDVCTLGDTCENGLCEPGFELDCDDGNVCTDDSCDPAGGCLNQGNLDDCDDGNACTDADKCEQGKCLPGAPVDCDDGNPCTDDACDPGTGCTHTHNTADCSDGDKCTLDDKCQQGACVGGGLQSCDDGNLCTDDGCEPATGCTFIANDAVCDDLNACTLSDQCKQGQCVGGQALDCDDANECTQDACAPESGCLNTPVPNGAACNGGGDWKCQDGICTEFAQGDPMIFITSSNGSVGFWGYDVNGNQWHTLPNPPTHTHSQISTDGKVVYLMASNNTIYSYTASTKNWASVQNGPGNDTSSPIGFFKWTPHGFYYARDLQKTIRYSSGGGWSSFSLPEDASSGGSYDTATDRLYIREGWKLGLIIVNPQTHSVVKYWPNNTQCGENSRVGSYYSGNFYTRESSKPFIRMDVGNGSTSNTGINPSEHHAATDVDPQTGNIYVGPYGPTGTKFQVYNVPKNTLTTLASVPAKVSNHSTIVFVQTPQ